MDLLQRGRRLRQSKAIRSLVKENKVGLDDLIAPLFVAEGVDGKESISSMPGIFRYNIKLLIDEIGELKKLGIQCISLFPAIREAKKDARGTEALNPDGIYLRAIREIKNAFPDILLMTDVALDPYSSDGHDGVVDKKTGKILNDETLDILTQMALVQAVNGSDIIGPSDMMDGRVLAIRQALESDGHNDTMIMSYTAKYASSFYGPFRDALGSAPKKGDKKTYQMDYSNVLEALTEMEQDISEGADIIMVKPGLPYLDVISTLSSKTTVPIAAYNVSGEYAMIKAAHQNGWLNETDAMVEILTAFKRAGATMILTYFAKDMAKLLNN